MNYLEERVIACPCCGECITILIDCSVQQQTYVEDCQVCCQPVVLTVNIDDENRVCVSVRQENS